MDIAEKKIEECTKPTKEAEDKMLERSKYVYEQVNGWTINADSKVSVSCGIFTGVYGVITFLAERLYDSTKEHTINPAWDYIYKCAFILSAVLLVIALFFYVRSIWPNLASSGEKNKRCNEKKNNKKKANKEYPIFFGDIESLEYSEYEILMKKASESSFCSELLLETWFNSKNCMNKMKRYKKGLIFSSLAIFSSIVSLIVQFILYR